MPRLFFQTAAGGRHEVTAEIGSTVMEAAVDNNVPGIVAECGGACACATCHAYIEAPWADRLPPMSDMEDAMLDAAVERRSSSRLTCQLEISADLDGLVVQVAENEV